MSGPGGSGAGELPSSMIDRMTLIIDAIGGGSARLGVDALVRRTGLPRSTVRRILEQLVRLNWLTQHVDGYSIGRRLGGVVAQDRGHHDVRAAAAGHLHRLHVSTGLVAHLARDVGAEVYFLDKVGGRGADIVPSRVGGRAPIHATALGKSILAWWQPEQVEELLAAGLPRLTHRTITDLATMHEELARIRRRQGVAHARGEHADRVACVAASVRTPDRTAIASISLSGVDVGSLEGCAPMVLDAARRISADLFPSLRGRPADDGVEVRRDAWTPQMLDRVLQRGHRDAV